MVGHRFFSATTCRPNSLSYSRQFGHICYWRPNSRRGRTLLVTSAEPAEGKTVSAANIALLLARLNQRVILIDADLRNPQLHEVFGEGQEPGLADVLTGTTTSGVFRKTKAPGLWLMPAGSATGNPSDLLGSVGFNELIQDLRKRFDWIVLDSSPVLAVTDPCLIARAVSGVLLVVDCWRTRREVAAAAVERLDSVQANVVGAMLNRVVLNGRGKSYLPYYHRDTTRTILSSRIVSSRLTCRLHG